MNPVDKWTVADVGRAVDSLRVDTERQVEALVKEIDEIRSETKNINRILIIGNGEPSLREVVRSNMKWIEGANRFVWIIVTILVGQTIAFIISLGMQLEQLRMLANK